MKKLGWKKKKKSCDYEWSYSILQKFDGLKLVSQFLFPTELEMLEFYLQNTTGMKVKSACSTHEGPKVVGAFQPADDAVRAAQSPPCGCLEYRS